MSTSLFKGNLVAAICLMGAPGLAGPLEGEWCHPKNGGFLVIEPGSVGIGEHVVCDWQSQPGASKRVVADLWCREWRYTNDSEPILVKEGPERVALRLLARDRLHVSFDGDTPFIMEPCEW